MMVEVIRPFDGHQAGEILDASAWRWTEQLIEQRYVRPVYGAVADTPVKPAGARRGSEA